MTCVCHDIFTAWSEQLTENNRYIGIVLNVLVIYFANQTKLPKAFGHLNAAVKHLAVSDLLYALVACPVLLVNFRMGKFQQYLGERKCHI